MSQTTKISLVLLAFMVWCGVSWKWYTCRIRGLCAEATVKPMDKEESPPAAAEVTGPLLFKWNSAEPIRGKNFDVYRDSILKTLKEGEALNITGYYFEGEQAPASHANIGLARAQAVIKLFAEKVPADRFKPSAREVAFHEEVKNQLFVGAEYLSVTNNEFVEETADSIVIYFPSGSAEKQRDSKVDEFMVKLSKRLNKTKEHVVLTGHSDNRGDEKLNKELALKRAKSVLALLTKKGINKSRIKVVSMGEKEPIANNKTPEGQSRNRRVVVRVVN